MYSIQCRSPKFWKRSEPNTQILWLRVLKAGKHITIGCISLNCCIFIFTDTRLHSNTQHKANQLFSEAHGDGVCVVHMYFL